MSERKVFFKEKKRKFLKQPKGLASAKKRENF